MPISEKIRNKINGLNEEKGIKELMIAILEEEDKGNHRFKDTYMNLVSEYLDTKEGDKCD